MVKATKKMKRAKLKTKKKTSSKVKGRPLNSKKNSGAPEIIKSTIMKSHDNELHSNASEPPSEIVYKLVRKVFHVDHIENKNKAIRNAKHGLKKAENSGLTDEIDEAESTLQEAIRVKEEALQWTHPDDALTKLEQILEYQKKTSNDMETIEKTKEFILDAEDSQRFIDQGQEDTFYYKLIRTDKSLIDLKKSNYIINDSDSENEDTSKLPPIQHQKIMNDKKMSKIQNQEMQKDQTIDLFSQQIQEIEKDINDLFMEDKRSVENNTKFTNFITPTKALKKMEIEKLDEGEITPKSGSKQKISINMVQDKLKSALQILSPKEKLEKIRNQAKTNAIAAKNKIKKMKEKELEATTLKVTNTNVSPKKSKDSIKNPKKSKIQNKKESEEKKTKEKESKRSKIAKKRKIIISQDSEDSENSKNNENSSDNTDSKDSKDKEKSGLKDNEYEDESDSEYSEKSTRKKVKAKTKSDKKQTKVNLTRNYSTYFSVKLKVEKGNVPTKQLTKAIN